MKPLPVPDQAKAGRPHLAVLQVGPPRGVSAEDCDTVETLAGRQDSYQVYCDYWRPTPEELEQLAAGGFIELIQYTPQMVMHSMAVWPPSESTQLAAEPRLPDPGRGIER